MKKASKKKQEPVEEESDPGEEADEEQEDEEEEAEAPAAKGQATGAIAQKLAGVTGYTRVVRAKELIAEHAPTELDEIPARLRRVHAGHRPSCVVVKGAGQSCGLLG